MRLPTILLLLLTMMSFHIFAQPTGAIDIAVSPKKVDLFYNRSVKSAGAVITYGNPRLENHTLDLALLPDGRFVAVEDRYGIAILDMDQQRLVDRWTFFQDPAMKSMMSTFSGIKAFEFQGKTYLTWGAASRANGSSAVMLAEWDGTKIDKVETLLFNKIAPAPSALPNEVEVELTGDECYLYVVLNGNNQVSKVRFSDRKVLWTSPTGVAPFGLKRAKGKVYVTNWGGPAPSDPTLETAGVPWGAAYVDPRTGAISQGSVSVFEETTGVEITEIPVRLHPNALVVSPDQSRLYIANGNSDVVSIVDIAADTVIEHLHVGLFQDQNLWSGSSPNGLALNESGELLFVSNGLDHAVAVVSTGNQPAVLGFIPTEAYPAGLVCVNNTLYVANLEAKGARVLNKTPQLEERFEIEAGTSKGAYNAHEQYASLSIIPVPKTSKLARYTRKVERMAQTQRAARSRQLPRPGVAPRPVPERIGEPSVFQHVVYIIKENRTYDQVYGDYKKGRGKPEFCIFGDSVTPNQHELARKFAFMDNYFVSGKSSAEGHQWTDAGIVSDYVEKSVRAWFRSYPHRQYDAMVYTEEGFIWNHALDHGKSVRIYGEACFTEFDESLQWRDIYQKHTQKEPFAFRNTSTISRVRPILSQNYPGYDNPKINDQLRADAFIQELKAYEALPGDELPQLMILALPNDHTAGTSPGFPTPRAQVADNDLALARIVEALMQSRFWPNTVIFVTEDDSQNGWDHISAYRTGALVISPYSVMNKTVRTAYNQTSMLRTIEQILGLPPMNTIDATAKPMFDCFNDQPATVPFQVLPNRIPLDEMNPDFSMLQGKALYYARESAENAAEGVDTGEDDLMNRILWFSAKGEAPYPGSGKAKRR